MRRRARSRSNEEGAILILFVLFLVGFLGVASLVFDVRLAALSQQQMQVAADFATVQGLSAGVLEGGDPEILGRQAAVSAVSWTFDDDYGADLTDDRLQLGAGPLVNLSGGQPGTNANALLEPAGVYDPLLELNLGNVPSGDLVLGQFIPGPVSTESETYVRDDFDPAGVPEALLVRIRRTRDELGLDRVPGVSSSGPPLPLIFGLGTTIGLGDGSNVRTEGLNVRAAAIAEARRALAVPPRQLLTVGVLVSAWENIVTAGTTVNGTVTPAGVWTSGGVIVGGNVANAVPGNLRNVGQTAVVTPVGPGALSGERVVPLIQAVGAQPIEAGGPAWIVGFARVQATLDDTGTTWSLTRLPSQVLPGSSAVSGEALRVLVAGAFPVSVWQSFTDPVLSPVLVR